MDKRSLWVGIILFSTACLSAQSINSGTIVGTVTDESGAVVRGASILLRNPVASYQQSAVTDASGSFRLTNIPQNNYQLIATAPGFAAATLATDIRSSLPVTMNLTLKVAAATASVTVEATEALVESDPSAHQDVDRSSFMKLPTFDPGGQLSQAITYSTGGVAADANGFFHPLGDHAQVSFVIDGQPISDQQSKVFSTQIPADALQSMELITGAPDAEYGDKTSLIVNATTRSGLGASKMFGTINSQWGSFGTWGGQRVAGLWRTEVRKFPRGERNPVGPFPGYAGIPAYPRQRQQREHLRPLRLAAHQSRRRSPESVHGAQLVPGSQQLRPVVAGSKSSGYSRGALRRAISTRSTPTRC